MFFIWRSQPSWWRTAKIGLCSTLMVLSVKRDLYRVTPAVLLHDPSFLRSLPHFVAFFLTSKGVRISCSLDPTGQSYAWTPTKAMYDCPKGTLRLLFQLGFSQRFKGGTKFQHDSLSLNYEMVSLIVINIYISIPI